MTVFYCDNIQKQKLQEHKTYQSFKQEHNLTSSLTTVQVFHKALEKFSGSLFRLAISCENKMHPEESENQCLLLKFGNTTVGLFLHRLHFAIRINTSDALATSSNRHSR